MLLNLRDIIVSYSENTLRISYFFLTIKQFLDILFVKLKEKKTVDCQKDIRIFCICGKQ